MTTYLQPDAWVVTVGVHGSVLVVVVGTMTVVVVVAWLSMHEQTVFMMDFAPANTALQVLSWPVGVARSAIVGARFA